MWIAVSRRDVPASKFQGVPAAWGAPHAPSDDEAPLFGMGDLRVLVGFPFRAMRRHRRLAASLFLGIMACTLLAALLLQRHYHVETKFLAAQNVVMPALGNPRRSVPNEYDVPTRQAAEAVLRRENLIQIIRETNLLATFQATRPALGRLRDLTMRLVKGPMSDSDQVNALVGLLEKRMTVETNDRVVTIGIDWMEPVSAYQIVQSAQQNFFDQRHASAVSMIGESIGILEGHVAASEQAIESALAQIKQYAPAGASARPVRMTMLPASTGARRASPEEISVRAELEAEQQTITDLERSRRERVGALENRLAELHNVYGPAHPEVISTQENLRALSSDSPQLLALRSKASTAASRLQSLGGRAADAPSTSREPAFSRAAIERMSATTSEANEDPRLTYAKSRLRIATGDYGDLLDRLEAARIELETARASFKYQYNILTPAQIPKAPSKPSIPLLIVGGLVLATLLGLFAAVSKDMGGGRVVETWQVNRMLALPILAEIERT